MLYLQVSAIILIERSGIFLERKTNGFVTDVVSHVADNFAMARATLRGHIEGVTSQLIFSSTLMFILMAPILVIIGWIANISLSLNFLLLEVLSVLVPAFIMNKWTREGQMHWLHGALMIVIYGILAIAFYFHPDPL